MEILEALKLATKAISAPYFLLPVAGQDQPIKRERVYCYELYHQLRLTSPESRLTLMGEPDKHGHPQIPSINPDLILHVPGSNKSNAVAIEVECRVNREHLCKDLRNLKIMQEHHYRTLVLLLFANPNVPWVDLKAASEQAEVCLENIIVLLHRAAGVAATRETAPNADAA